MFSLLSCSMPRSSTRSLRWFIPVLFLLLTHSRVAAQTALQKDFLLDSLKKNLSAARTDPDRIYQLCELAAYYSGLENELSEQYATQASQIAELSRDRKLIIYTYLRNGDRCLDLSSLEGSIQSALESYQNAEKVARENGLDDELAYSYTGLSRVYRAKGEYDKALNYNHLSLSIASSVNNDSLKVAIYRSMGNTYIFRNEKLLAFRSCLEALNIAELSKKEDLLKLAYRSLSDFYTGIEDYDKAIDYTMKVMAINRKINDRYDLLEDFNKAGALFTRKKKIALALSMYEHAITLADSLRFPTYKINSYLGIANMYFINDDDVKGMQYLNEHKEVLNFFRNAGLGFVIDVGYGSIYTDFGKYDSAYYFFKKAEPEIERKANQYNKYDFDKRFGQFYEAKGAYHDAILCFLEARKIGEGIKDVNMLQTCAKYLDTLYGKSGDFKTAYFYNIEYNKYKDSLKTMSKETELLKLEVDNDNKRRERLAKEEEESTLRRHNIQYMGLTAGLAALFVALVALGFFVVSPRIIRALGFFSFIFLFEFIILLADKQIHELTHGEPWKILLIKIFLAAVLLPLHHWVEHKVIHYLTSRRKISTSISFLGRPFRSKTGVPAE
ncbi:MAG TPA: tetratricopeptide repeat protein [Puia sp.]|nr:tetratricopeptide repeat protein [Puia sp.]